MGKTPSLSMDTKKLACSSLEKTWTYQGMRCMENAFFNSLMLQSVELNV